ncbi:MAG: type II toxin-antitoxin system HicB family antitoxin [Pseudomonadota bacterium]
MSAANFPDPMDYPIELRRLSEEDGGGWLVAFPDLPGCMSDGETIEEAMASGKEAFLAWIEANRAYGRPDPTPLSGGTYSGQFRLRTPKSLHAALAARARAEGVSLNTMALTLIAQGLGRSEPKQDRHKA